MNIGVYMYDQSPLFEISVLAYILHTKYDIILLSNCERLLSSEGILYECTYIADYNNSSFDALVICGGNVDDINHHRHICQLIRKTNQNKKPLGAICAGINILSAALNMEFDETDDVRSINNILISPAHKYAEFGVEFGKLIGVYRDLDDYNETVTFFCHR